MISLRGSSSLVSPLIRRQRPCLAIVGNSDVTARCRSSYSSEMRKRLSAAEYRQPDLALAKAMPLSHQEMDNSTLVALAEMGNHKACKEMLTRHIMVVDNADYGQARENMEKISAVNKNYMYLLSLPYQVGITVALSGAAFAFPMVFQEGVAKWFNAHYVTTEVPHPDDLETWLEVGSWTWNWMEPPLGTVSFVLLALQFARAQMQNLGIKPYTERIKRWRAERLSEAFPDYNPRLVMAYSETSTIKVTQKEIS